VKTTPEAIQSAVANSSLGKMREKEVREPVRASVKGRFIGAGQVQGWRSKLNAGQIRLIEQYAGRELMRLGYPSSDQVMKTQAERNPVLA
jgi:hypothetical protein